MDQPQIRINGQVAWVSGLEKGQRQAKSGEKQTISNYGTNVFVNEGGRWLMVSHQRLFKIGAASGYDHFEMVPLCYGRGGWAASASAQQFRGEV
jgi:hypothetical protein